MIAVKQTTFNNQTVFGISDGDKWAPYCYPSLEQARDLLELHALLAYPNPVSLLDFEKVK